MDAQLLAQALSQNSEIEICGACSNSKSALAAVAAERPQVAIISSQLEDGEAKGFEVARDLRTAGSNVHIIMLLDSSDRAKVVEAFRSGAKGVFCRDQSIKSLVKCIYSVQIGQVWANSSELAFLLEALTQSPSREVRTHASAKLSKRENDVVRAVVEGRTNREIASHLGLTEHTVKNYLFRIFDKVGVSTRVELVLHAFASAQAGVAEGNGVPAPRPPKSDGLATLRVPSRHNSRSRSR